MALMEEAEVVGIYHKDCIDGTMAAAALLKAKPKPTDSDINSFMTNICACGTYPRVVKAIKRAAGV